MFCCGVRMTRWKSSKDGWLLRCGQCGEERPEHRGMTSTGPIEIGSDGLPECPDCKSVHWDGKRCECCGHPRGCNEDEWIAQGGATLDAMTRQVDSIEARAERQQAEITGLANDFLRTCGVEGRYIDV